MKYLAIVWNRIHNIFFAAKGEFVKITPKKDERLTLYKKLFSNHFNILTRENNNNHKRIKQPKSKPQRFYNKNYYNEMTKHETQK